jgi:glucose-1-phosphate adenylyltransferase
VTIKRAIIDKSISIPDNARVGVDREWDARHFTISDGGIVVMPKHLPFPHF